jgi:Zn-dependent protease
MGGPFMSDPLHWTVHLGRVSGVRVRVHYILIAFAVLSLVDAALAPRPRVVETAAWLGLLLVALAVHEVAHALAAWRLGIEPQEVRLWPLGNLTGPLAPPSRSAESLIVAAAGPIASLAVALAVALGLSLGAGAQMVFNPFRHGEGGAPWLADGRTLAAPLSGVWLVGWFGFLNWILFLLNLIPAAPLDGGRIFRGLLEGPWSGPGRDGLLGPWTARVCAIVLLIVGAVWALQGDRGGTLLVVLAVVIFWLSRLESRMLEEGGFFDDTLFGYDFSQGYTSLEASSAATVRPRREGSLTRWRRRRSDQRRRRQEARAAAEEQRMDEILDKLHRLGRAGLSDAEHRFLLRVSHRYKHRSR